MARDGLYAGAVILLEPARGYDMDSGVVKRRCCICLLFMGLLFPGAASRVHAGAEEVTPWRNPESLLAYANALMLKGESQQAATEYKRFLYLYPEHPDALEVELHLGLAYRSSGLWKPALETFYAVAALNEKENRLSARATFHLAETYLLEGLHEDALREYRGFISRYPSDPLVPEARYGAGWATMALGDGRGASAQFSGIDPSSPLFPEARDLALSSLDVDRIRRPSPLAAGVLSAILPGAGHAYAGRPRNALVSFLINGALIAGAIALFARGNEGAGILVTFFESGWYVGGIRSAARDAREAYRADLYDNLRSLARSHDFPLRLEQPEDRFSVEFFHIPLDRILP